ncbi:MAG TPA: hypothetical protein VF323_11765 [Candidatus Limnocylindrales bacterium]
MIDLLRADLLRLRHRGDLWVGVGAVLVLVVLGYVTSANNANQVNFGFPSDQPIPPDVLEQFARQRDPYTFPLSIVTTVQTGGGIVAAVMAFIAAAWLGTEFLWGTIRQLALIRPDRWRVVVSRTIVCALLGAVLVGVLIVLGTVLPVVVPLAGSGHAPTVTVGAIAAGAAVQWVTVVAVIGVALTFTALTRSSSLGIVFSVVFFIADSALASNPAWLTSEVLLWVPRLMLGERLRALQTDVQVAFGPADPNGYVPPVTPLTLAAPLGLAIIAAWLVVLAILPCLIVRRADIRE